MEHEAKRYTVITGASSGIGCKTAKAFAARGKNLVIAARRGDNLEVLKSEIEKQYPAVDVVIRSVDLSVLENVHQFYSSLRNLRLETWVNNAGFGNYDSVAQQNLEQPAEIESIPCAEEPGGAIKRRNCSQGVRDSRRQFALYTDTLLSEDGFHL